MIGDENMFGLGGKNDGKILKVLEDMAFGAQALSIAVSYVQLSGWDLLKPLIQKAKRETRILCTDQLGISDPVAIKKMIEAGINVRAFSGSRVYHPKVYIAHYEDGNDRFVLGSANLSRSALKTGVEAVITGDDQQNYLLDWFDEMFTDPKLSCPFDDERLNRLNVARASRLKGELTYRKTAVSTTAPKSAVADFATDEGASELIETAFAELAHPIVTLNFDQGGNTLRNLENASQVLRGKLPYLALNSTGRERELRSKRRSELKSLGIYDGKSLSPLGIKLTANPTIDYIALEWAKWLRAASEAELLALKPTGSLVNAKRVLTQFWTLPKDVTDFFITNSFEPNASTKRILQTIELLANTTRPLQKLTIEDVMTLSQVLTATSALRPRAKMAIENYVKNKGLRSWNSHDRQLILNAWNL